MSSPGVAFEEGWVGRKRVMRDNRLGFCAGGRFRIDLPGVGITTAEDDGELEEDEADCTDAIGGTFGAGRRRDEEEAICVQHIRPDG